MIIRNAPEGPRSTTVSGPAHLSTAAQPRTRFRHAGRSAVRPARA